MHGKFRFFTIWLLHIVDTISSLNCYTLFLYAFVLFYAFVFLYSCISMLLYFYALVPCPFVSPCFFVPMFFASISTPQKINMLLLPYAFVSDYFPPLHICVSMISYYYIFVYLYLYLPMSFISMTLYLSVYTPLSSYVSFIMYSVHLFYIKTSLTFFYYMITLRS